MPHGFAKVVIFKGKDDMYEGIWRVDKKKIVIITIDYLILLFSLRMKKGEEMTKGSFLPVISKKHTSSNVVFLE